MERHSAASHHQDTSILCHAGRITEEEKKNILWIFIRAKLNQNDGDVYYFPFFGTQCLHRSSFSSVLEWDISPIETWQSLSWCDSVFVLDSREGNIFFAKMSETVSILVTERRKTTRWNTSKEGSWSKDTCSQGSGSLSLPDAVILWGRSRFGVNVPRFSISVPDAGNVLTFPSKPQVFSSSLHDRKSQKALHLYGFILKGAIFSQLRSNNNNNNSVNLLLTLGRLWMHVQRLQPFLSCIYKAAFIVYSFRRWMEIIVYFPTQS